MSPTIIKVILLTVVVQIGCVSNRVSCSLDALYEQASALEVGIMMALFAFVPALFAIRSGQWIDSIGPKKPVLRHGFCVVVRPLRAMGPPPGNPPHTASISDTTDSTSKHFFISSCL